MKKVYQLIAAASLSLLTVGAFAQIQSNVGMHHPSPRAAQQLNARASNGNTNRVTGGPVHAYVDYVGGDEYINTGLMFYYWNPPLYMNMAYTLADTLYSPYNSGAANTYTPNYCSVAYDTLWDDMTQSFYSTSNIKKGTMMIDTIWAYMAYNNNSGTNDTVIFQVNSVDANGFPAATQYGADTVILNNGSLTYNTKDSLQVVYVVPTSPIMIPSTARHGWNFSINMKVHGSKMDTVGVWYFSQGSTCTGGFAVTNAYTSMGVPDGHCPCVNSFVTGNYWFNQPSFSGTGTALTWPTFTGAYPGYCTNGTYYWYNQLLSGCTDTSYYPEQDIAIMASVDFQDPTGVNEVASKDFSVGQNYPNPFNNSTEITYNLTKESNVVFTVYDMTGRELVNNNYTTVTPGQHVVSLSATQFTPGIYFYTFNVNGTKVTRKMVITQ